MTTNAKVGKIAGPHRTLIEPNVSWNVFKGYDCQRVNKDNVALWRTVACIKCHEPLTLNFQHLHTQAKDVVFPYFGINIWNGDIPAAGNIPYAGGPLVCHVHFQEWMDNPEGNEDFVPTSFNPEAKHI